MNNSNLDNFSNLIKYITIVHHTHGNIRVKFDPKILDEIKGDSLELERYIKAIDGIKEIKINKIAKSARILYDKSRFSKDEFESIFDLK